MMCSQGRTSREYLGMSMLDKPIDKVKKNRSNYYRLTSLMIIGLMTEVERQEYCLFFLKELCLQQCFQISKQKNLNR